MKRVALTVAILPAASAARRAGAVAAHDAATALLWLNENPNDPLAPQVREKLRKLGVQVPDPP